jgi:uncharacterized membrane protein YdjX (TVP38/TMEM64 family)
MSERPARGNLKPAVKLIFWIILIAALIVAAKYFNVQGLLKNVLDWIAGLGPWGPVTFIFIYILATVLFIPGSILTLGAGAIFGVLWGSIYVSIGATIGATAAFLAGRYLARQWVEKRIEGNNKFKAIDQAVAREGWKIVGLTRLSPVFPFNLLNYAFGITQVSFKDYFFPTWIGITPGTVLYVYIGSLAGSLAMLGTKVRSRTTAEWTFYAVGLIAAIAVTLYVTRIAHKALEQRVS